MTGNLTDLERLMLLAEAEKRRAEKRYKDARKTNYAAEIQVARVRAELERARHSLSREQFDV